MLPNPTMKNKQSIPNNGINVTMDHSSKICFPFLYKKKHFSLEIKLDKDSFEQNENFDVNIFLSNTATLQCLKASFIKTIVAGDYEYETVLSCKKYRREELNVELNIDSYRETKKKIAIQFFVDSLCHPSFTSKLLRCQYFIVLQARSSCVSSTEIRREIKIHKNFYREKDKFERVTENIAAGLKIEPVAEFVQRNMRNIRKEKEIVETVGTDVSTDVGTEEIVETVGDSDEIVETVRDVDETVGNPIFHNKDKMLNTEVHNINYFDFNNELEGTVSKKIPSQNPGFKRNVNEDKNFNAYKTAYDDKDYEDYSADKVINVDEANREDYCGNNDKNDLMNFTDWETDNDEDQIEGH